MPLTIVRQDITKMNVDAVVNAANTALQMGGGVCGAIFEAAGAGELRKACDRLSPIRTGEAVITPGFALQARYIIHAAGPVYNSQKEEQSRKLLRSAYLESLKLAEAKGCESVAFPLISSGIYGYPREQALRVARLAIEEFLSAHEMQVYLVVFDRSAFVISRDLLGSVESYIDEHYMEKCRGRAGRRLLRVEEDVLQEAAALPSCAPMPPPCPAAPAPGTKEREIDDLIRNLDEPFSDALLRLIDTKGKADVEVYKKANIDRKLFSKIRTGKGYTPRKSTILALAIALELTLSETAGLLERAGYALSHANKFDVIVEYFILHQKYNIFEINEVLFQYDQPLLGA